MRIFCAVRLFARELDAGKKATHEYVDERTIIKTTMLIAASGITI